VIEKNNCNLNKCLNYLNDGKCDIDLPILKKRSSPNNINCKYYEEEKDIGKFKIGDGISKLLNQEKTTPNIPINVEKNNIVKTEMTNGGYIFRRMADRSYKVLNSDGNKVNAKPILIINILELDKTSKKEILCKKGTRPLGNMLFRLKGITF